MAYSIETKEKVIELRKRGYSLSEIHKETGISKSVLSGWLRDIVLGKAAKDNLLKKIKLGQFVSAENKKKKTKEVSEKYFQDALKEIDRMKEDEDFLKVLCCLIYWCEGTKDIRSSIVFTNSDPQLVKTFVSLFRKSFEIDEKKFRVCVHIHKYHNPKKQIKFWSKITSIPEKQFIKPFLKQNTGKRTRPGYEGCVSVRYYDNNLARKVLATGKAFLSKYGGMV